MFSIPLSLKKAVFPVMLAALVLLFGQTHTTHAAYDSTPNEASWSANGTVRTIAPASDGSAYIGGDFTAIGPRSNNGTIVSTATGYAQEGVALPNGRVQVVIQDGAGGWYIGGEFQKIDGVTQAYIAHIESDGSFDTGWNPNADGEVYAMLLDGTTLYVGGNFSNIGGQARNRIAAISTVTGLATAWNPTADGTVVAMELDTENDLLYVGGNFANIGGEVRATLAALSTSTGLANAWNPGTDISITDLELNAAGTLIYVGGNFSTAGGETRANLAAINTTTGAATAWAPDPDATVQSMALDETNSVLYIGGDFSNAGGQARAGLAKINTSTGLATAWNPSTDSTVDSILLTADKNTLYVAGGFSTLGTNVASRTRFGAVDTSSGAATAWNTLANTTAGTTFTLAFGATESTIYLGGDFSFAGGVPRSRIAHILADGTLDMDWNPGAGSTVSALVLSGTTLYAGGDFSTLGGQTREKIGAVSTTTGLATSFNPTANLAVRSLHLHGTTLYAGGEFTQLGGENRANIGAVSTATGLVTAWNPTGNETVWAIETNADGSVVYVGGQFTSMGGETRNRLAAINASTGAVTAWDPNADGPVRDIKRYGDNLFVGGQFDNVGGQVRLRLAEINGTTGLATSWETEGYLEGDPGDEGDPEDPFDDIEPDPASIWRIAIVDGKVYVGGFIVSVGITPRVNVAAFDVTTGDLDDWNPGISGSIFALAAYGDSAPLYIGGGFTFIGTKSYVNAVQFLPVGATVSAASGTATEAGVTATYTVVLTSKPTASVTITPTPDADVTVSPASRTFTTSNWDSPQTFTVTAVDDTEREGTHTGTLTHAATSADALYNGVSVGSAVVSITDNERSGGGGGITPVPTTVTITSPNGGEVYVPGENVTITWVSTGRAYLFNLAFSADAGVTWQMIASSRVIASDSFNWVIPNVQTEHALIRVRSTDLAVTIAEDRSDAPFRIGNIPPKEADITLPIDRARFLPPGTPVTGVARSPVSGLLEQVTPVAPGDFVRSPSFPTVYVVTEGFGRRPFPDAVTFFTHADSFAQVRDVSDATITLLALEAPMFPKTDTTFVKITSTPETYVMQETETGALVLRWITTESIATALAGAEWNAFILDIPVTSFTRLTVGAPITDAAQVTIDRTKLKRRGELVAK